MRSAAQSAGPFHSPCQGTLAVWNDPPAVFQRSLLDLQTSCSEGNVEPTIWWCPKIGYPATIILIFVWDFHDINHPLLAWGIPMLVGGLNPSEKYEFVNWDDYSQYMGKCQKWQPNHQPAWLWKALHGNIKALVYPSCHETRLGGEHICSWDHRCIVILSLEIYGEDMGMVVYWDCRGWRWSEFIMRKNAGGEEIFRVHPSQPGRHLYLGDSHQPLMRNLFIFEDLTPNIRNPAQKRHVGYCVDAWCDMWGVSISMGYPHKMIGF